MPPNPLETSVAPALPVLPDVPLRQHIVAIVVAVCFVAFLLYLAGKGRFNLRYMILWFSLGSFALVLALFPRLLYVFAGMMGIGLPVNALFFVALFFFALQVVQLTVSITELEEQNKTLCQELALTRLELEDLHGKSGE